ncbi:HAD family phosphatase [Leucobacter sp. 1207-22]
MDGTIIDSEPLWLRVELEMLARFGIEMPVELPDQLVGTGLRDAARRFQELGVPLSIDAIVDEWADGVVAGMQAEPAVWRPGARELLSALGVSGVPAALVTMSVRRIADAVVEMLPPGTFSAVIAGDEVQHEKPHPEPYLLGAQALNVDIVECVAFEDSRTGIRSAAASGAVTIGLPNMVSLADTPAHVIWETGLSGRDVEAVANTFTLYRSALSQDRDEQFTSTIEETS